jgi:cytochrome c5
MKINILLVATLSLLVVSCGKSDESAQVTSTGNEVPDTQVTTVTEAPATAETIKLAEEAVAVSEPVTQAQQQADSAAGGEAVYKKACISCHMTGAAGAPKLGDASAWESRIAKGTSALVQSAIAGVPGTAMMARGACGTCSDDDIKAAVDYMIAQVR